jgi:DNA-binding MarR family transcriptional regulator
MKTGAGQQDFVDTIIEVIGRWHGSWQDPEIAESKALAYRVRRLAHRLETDLKRELAPHGIELWELELLACLLRAEPDHRLSAGTLLTQLQLTSGAITNRVRRLELNGWVTRDLDPDDRRSVLVTLTPAGKKRALEVFSAKTDTWYALLSALSPADQRRLNDDLRTVLLALEGPAQPALQPLRIPARTGRRSTPACRVLRRYTPLTTAPPAGQRMVAHRSGRPSGVGLSMAAAMAAVLTATASGSPAAGRKDSMLLWPMPAK